MEKRTTFALIAFFLIAAAGLQADTLQDQGPNAPKQEDGKENRQAARMPSSTVERTYFGLWLAQEMVSESGATAGGSYIKIGGSASFGFHLSAGAWWMADLSPHAFSDNVLGADFCVRFGEEDHFMGIESFFPLNFCYAFSLRDQGHSLGLGTALFDLHQFTEFMGLRLVFLPVRFMYSLSRSSFWFTFSLIDMYFYGP